MNEFKTHTCNEISIQDVGKKVRIAGFVETIRDLGGLVFLDIRDMYRNNSSCNIKRISRRRHNITYTNRIICYSIWNSKKKVRRYSKPKIKNRISGNIY